MECSERRAPPNILNIYSQTSREITLIVQVPDCFKKELASLINNHELQFVKIQVLVTPRAPVLIQVPPPSVRFIKPVSFQIHQEAISPPYCHQRLLRLWLQGPYELLDPAFSCPE